MRANLKVYTIGHSTRKLDEFIEILKAYEIKRLADVRTMPMSRFASQFNHDTLEKELKKHGISYQHMKILGGLRPAKKDSINQGWHNKSFRGYADYMQTEDFKKGLDELMGLAKKEQIAIMCAEAVPWRCHRSMIGDALLVRHIEVIDIFDAKKAEPEKLTDFAVVKGDSITYPPA